MHLSGKLVIAMGWTFFSLGLSLVPVSAHADITVADITDARTPKSPMLYVTDLYHPHGDPDDHYDIMTLFAIQQLDIRGIVIDMGKEGQGRPGLLTLQQMMKLTGRSVPYATGLNENLQTPTDTAESQPPESQAGVRLILKSLQESPEPLVLFAVGSLRDIAAAYNRNPALFKQKVKRFYVNAGNSDGGKEWNVDLDVPAYVRLMRSDLPIYWMPCFGKEPYFSFWKFQQKTVLEHAPKPLQNFFMYALLKKDPAREAPLPYLDKEPDAEALRTFGEQERWMWCTVGFLDAVDPDQTKTPLNTYCRFDVVKVVIEDNGRTTLSEAPESRAIRTIKRLDSYTNDQLIKVLQVCVESFGGR